MKALITYNHVIDSEFLNNEQKILYYDYKKEKKEINIKLDRYKHTNEKIDITVIEIIEQDNIKTFLEIDDCINSRNYNNKGVLYIQFNEDIINYIQSKIIKKGEEYIINNAFKEGVILLEKNSKIIGVYNDKKYIHMSKIINSINFIISKIEITKEDIGKEIQLINNKKEYDINHDIENILIIINGIIKKNILTFKFDTVGLKKIYYISEDLTDMSSMFGDCSKLKEIDLASFDTSKVNDMSYMFWKCFGLEQINLTFFDTSNVTDMSAMFGRCL
jgi:surface protein